MLKFIAAIVLSVAMCACSQKEEPPLEQPQKSSPAMTPQSPAGTSSEKRSAGTSPATADRSRTASPTTPDSSKGDTKAEASGTHGGTVPGTQERVTSAEADNAAPPKRAVQKSNKSRKPNKELAKATSNRQRPPSDATSRWSEFQAVVARCETLTGDKRERCLDDATDAYRAAGLKCEALSDPDSKECIKYMERFNGTGSKQAITHTETPAITAATPGDPTPAQRNRDSTVQQQDAAGTLPESTRKD